MPAQPCPNCNATVPRSLDEASVDAYVNYYRCQVCGHVWTTSKQDNRILRHITPLKPKPGDAG